MRKSQDGYHTNFDRLLEEEIRAFCRERSRSIHLTDRQKVNMSPNIENAPLEVNKNLKKRLE